MTSISCFPSNCKSGKSSPKISRYCIDFEEDLISAEIALTGNEVYFDYDGDELSFGDYERVYESYNKPGYLTGWKDGKCALLKMDGTVLVPLSDNNGNNFDYYEQGLLITGSKERLGLSRISGEVILPKRYSKITVRNDSISPGSLFLSG